MATQRGYMLAEMDRSVENITMCLTHLDRVASAYEAHYPVVTEALLEVCKTLITIGEIIEKIKGEM